MKKSNRIDRLISLFLTASMVFSQPVYTAAETEEQLPLQSSAQADAGQDTPDGTGLLDAFGIDSLPGTTGEAEESGSTGNASDPDFSVDSNTEGAGENAVLPAENGAGEETYAVVPDGEAEEVPEEQLEERALEVTPQAARLYDGSGASLEMLDTVDRIWQSLYGEDPEPDTEPGRGGVKVSISGLLPEDVRAAAEFIAFERESAETEQEQPAEETMPQDGLSFGQEQAEEICFETPLLALDIHFTRADGSDYIPEEELYITLSGKKIGGAFARETYPIVYAHNEHTEESFLVVDDTVFSSDITVFRSMPESGENTDTAYWRTVDGRIAYEAGDVSGSVVFSENADGLAVQQSSRTLSLTLAPQEERASIGLLLSGLDLSEEADAGENAPDTIEAVPDIQILEEGTLEVSNNADPVDGESNDQGNDTRVFTITWKNGEEVLREEEVKAGDPIPSYIGEEPTREQTAQYTYTFAGWDPDSAVGEVVTEDITYTARFTETLRTYTIIWRNEDGTVLETDTGVPYGTVPEYNGATPTKSADSASTGYTFTGWNPSVATVTENAEYRAMFAGAALELFAWDERSNKPIEGAVFTLTNDATGLDVWSGRTGANGIAVAYTVEAESGGGQGVHFEKNSTYTVRQTATDAEHFLPLGHWVLTIGSDSRPKSMQVVCDADDLSTLPTGARSGDIRFYIGNRKSASITYDYNYPAEYQSDQPASVTTGLDFLSYAQAYTVGVIDEAQSTGDAVVYKPDPNLSDKGYEFVGWVDGDGYAWKTGDVTELDTMNTKSHTMRATWRVPMHVSVWQFDTGKLENAKVVGNSDVTFTTGERDRNYTDLVKFGQAFGNECNADVKEITDSDAWGFSFAAITNEKAGVASPLDANAVRVKSIRYDSTSHRWEYQAEGGNVWKTFAVGDVVNLYYTSNAVNVKWVEQNGSAFTVLETKTFAVGSDRWYASEDLFRTLFPDNKNAKTEAVVYGDRYFHSYGLGGADAEKEGDLSFSGLKDFRLRNSAGGFLFREGDTGNGESVPNTLYLIYSKEIPESSVRFDIENNTGHDYAIKELRVANTDVLSQHRVILRTGSGLKLFDGATGEDWTEVLHADTNAAQGTSMQMVILDAAEQDFVLDGGFTETTEEADDYKISVGVASADRYEIVRKLLYRQSAVGNELVETKGVTKGPLDAQTGTTYVTFDDDLDGSLTVKKAWSADVNPVNYRVDVALYEIWPGESGFPTIIPLTQQEEETVAQTLRDQGCRVMKIVAEDNAGLYRITKDSQENGIGWSRKILYLPTGHRYYAVEKSVFLGSMEQIGRFERSYEVNTEAGEETMTNTRADDICRVWDNAKNEYVSFRTLTQAVDYIGANNTGAVIEMLQNYIVPEADAVEIPADLSVTLTTAEGIDGLTTAVVRRGFNGGDLFNVLGALSLENITLDAKIENAYFANTEYGGFVHVQTGGTLFVEDGAKLQNGRAEKGGGAIYAENGGTINFTGGTVTGCRAVTGNTTTGGAVEVGGTESRIYLSGNVRITGNNSRNIWLAYDSNEIIQVGILDELASVGIYVPDGERSPQYNAHGKPAKPFATFLEGAGGSANLNKLTNDSYSASSPSRKGYASTLADQDSAYRNLVVWGETFSLTVELQWLDADYQRIETQEGASVNLTLSDGSITKEEDRTAEGVSGSGTYTFYGLAKYASTGTLCKYYVGETAVSPADYEKISFYGDRGVRVDKSANMVNAAETYDNPVTCSAEETEQEIIVSNKYKYTDFTVTKKALGVDGQLSSSFVIFGIPKYGVGSVYDLPNGLRSLTAAEAGNGARFYSPRGGNRWVIRIDGEEVAFHRFYDGTLGIAAPDSPVSGDVRLDAGGSYAVWANDAWHELNYTGSFQRPDVRIHYERQDGEKGADRVSAGYTTTAAGGNSIVTVGDAENSRTFERLSSSYYYYAVETSVFGNGKNISGNAELISVYNPKYDYDQVNRSVKVTNDNRAVLAVEKKWTGDVTKGECVFEVYRLPEGVFLSDSAAFADLVANKKAGSTALGAPVMQFKVRDNAPDDRAGSWIHVVTRDDLRETGVAETDLDANYFAREVSANGVAVEKHGTDPDDASLDAIYEYTKDANLITVTNNGAILCKVVDDDANHTEHAFRTLREAYDYGTTRRVGSQDVFAIEMLRDYDYPIEDKLEIAAGKTVTLTTAATSGCQFNYIGEGTRATITRGTKKGSFIIVGDNTADAETTGVVLENISFDGAGAAVSGNSNIYGNNGGIVCAKNASVELKGTTLENGVSMQNAKADIGGAIYVQSGNVTVHCASFENCMSTNTGGDGGGGAIWCNGASMAVDDTVFEGCEAKRHGGAIYKKGRDSELGVYGTTFKKCSASSYGGAICFEGSTLIVDASRTGSGKSFFEDCHGNTRGAISHFIPSGSVVGASTLVKNSGFNSCTTNGTGNDDGGGAINCDAETLRVEGSSFSRCTSNGRGGAVQHYIERGKTEIKKSEIVHCDFSNCTSGSSGGGACCLGGMEVTATDSTFDTCKSTNSAGGALDICLHNVAKICAVTNCTFSGCEATQGGAICIGGTRLTVTNSSFTNCKMTGNNQGGAIAMNVTGVSFDYMGLFGCMFEGCESNNNGGAVYTMAKEVVIADYVPEVGETAHTTFTHCKANNQGGGMYQDNTATGSSLTIANASFISCTNVNNSNGGGLRSSADKAEITGSTFKDCIAQGGSNGGGGGIYHWSDNSASFALSDCSFDGCKTPKSDGGAIHVRSKSVSIERTTFDTCIAESNNGGAVRINYDGVTEFTAVECEFKACTAYSYGGGLSSNAKKNTLSFCTFKDCKSLQSNAGDRGGGAIYTSNGNDGSALNIVGCDFSNCSSEKKGGAIYTYNRAVYVGPGSAEDKEPVLTKFEHIESKDTGGAIYHNKNVESSIRVIGVTFDNCGVNAAASGGAIYSNALSMELSNDIFTNCYSGSCGGGINNDNGSANLIRVENCSFADCYTGQNQGGGIRAYAKKVEITGSRFVRCYTLGSHGGGLYYNNTGGELTVSDECAFENCYTATGDGGGIETNAKTMRLEKTGFINCHARGWGGGVEQTNNNEATESNVVGCVFENCFVSTHEGGGLRLSTRNAAVTDCTFTNCHSDGTGGQGGGGFAHGSENENGAAVVSDCRFTGCYCHETKNGGAILSRDRFMTVKNTVIDGTIDNPDVTYNADWGGGIYSRRSTLTVEGCTIRNCTVRTSGGGLYQNSENSREASVKDSTFENNSAKGTNTNTNADGTGGGAIYFRSNNILTLDHCTIEDNSAAVRGGGIYYFAGGNDNGGTNKKLVLKNGTRVTENHLESNAAEEAAGIYMVNGAVLVLGDEEIEADTLTVYDNRTADGTPSNLRMRRYPFTENKQQKYRNMNGQNGTDPYIELNSDLKHVDGKIDGWIGVCNPGSPNTQFGLGSAANREGVEYIKSDDNKMKGSIDAADATKKKLVWYMAPVCQITDADGLEVLQYGEEGAKVAAQFYSLAEAVAAYNNRTEGYFSETPGQIQMLVDEYRMDEETVPAIERNCVLTMEQSLPDCTIIRDRTNKGTMLTVATGYELTVTKLTLDGGSGRGYTVNTNGGIFLAKRGSAIKLMDGAVLQNSATGAGENGAGIYVETTASLEMHRTAAIRNCISGGSGGGVYLFPGSTMLMVDDAEISGCGARQNGGAVYVGNSAAMTLSDSDNDNPVITDNYVIDGNGAGIYLTGANSRLNMRGRLHFQVKTAETNESGETVAIITGENRKVMETTGENGKRILADVPMENGADVRTNTRQDIYLEFNNADAAQNIRLTGVLRSDAGSIWVWASSSEHNHLDKQFAVLAEGVTVSDETLRVFRDAVDNTSAENRTGQYYTGVKGSEERYVYWGVTGVDVSFLKIDGWGKPLSGAGFTLYKDNACKEPFEQSGSAAAAVSADGKTLKDTAGEILKQGTVLFEKLPVGIYYMQETAAPEGYISSLQTDKDGKTQLRTYIVVVGTSYLDSAKSREELFAKGEVLSDITEKDVAAQTTGATGASDGSGDGAADDAEKEQEQRQYAIFLIDDKTGKAVTTPDIAAYGILNFSAAQRKIILKKAEDETWKPISGAKFTLRAYDGQVIADDLTSLESGVLYIGMLPLGFYYMEETVVPKGYYAPQKNEYFNFKVTEDGVFWVKSDEEEVGPTNKLYLSELTRRSAENAGSNPGGNKDTGGNGDTGDNAGEDSGNTGKNETEGETEVIDFPDTPTATVSTTGPYKVSDVIQVAIKIDGKAYDSSIYGNYFTITSPDSEIIFNQNNSGILLMKSGETVTLTVKVTTPMWDPDLQKTIPAGYEATVVISVEKKDNGTTTVLTQIDIDDTSASLTIRHVAEATEYTERDIDAIVADGGLKKGLLYTRGSKVYFCYNPLTARDDIKYSLMNGLFELTDFSYVEGELKFFGAIVDGNSGAFNAGRGTIVKQNGHYYITYTNQSWYGADTVCEEKTDWFYRII